MMYILYDLLTSLKKKLSEADSLTETSSILIHPVVFLFFVFLGGFFVVLLLFFYVILLLGLLEQHPQSNCPGDTQQSLKLLISISFGFIELYKIPILIRETEV